MQSPLRYWEVFCSAGNRCIMDLSTWSRCVWSSSAVAQDLKSWGKVHYWHCHHFGQLSWEQHRTASCFSSNSSQQLAAEPCPNGKTSLEQPVSLTWLCGVRWHQGCHYPPIPCSWHMRASRVVSPSSHALTHQAYGTALRASQWVFYFACSPTTQHMGFSGTAAKIQGRAAQLYVAVSWTYK